MAELQDTINLVIVRLSDAELHYLLKVLQIESLPGISRKESLDAELITAGGQALLAAGWLTPAIVETTGEFGFELHPYLAAMLFACATPEWVSNINLNSSTMEIVDGIVIHRRGLYVLRDSTTHGLHIFYTSTSFEALVTHLWPIASRVLSSELRLDSSSLPTGLSRKMLADTPVYIRSDIEDRLNVPPSGIMQLASCVVGANEEKVETVLYLAHEQDTLFITCARSVDDKLHAEQLPLGQSIANHALHYLIGS